MIKKGIEYLKKYGIRDTINKIIFKYFKTYLGFFILILIKLNH